jgi:predicted phage baseplate assembly protein
MIPNFLPEWTNHNVSDPGVALIELFAWMTELTLYRLNRVPDRLYTSFLDLVGISPYPAEAATVPVSFIFSTVPDETVLIPTGTEVATLGDDPVVFSTLEDLQVVQPVRAFVWTTPSNGAGQPDEGKLKDVVEDLVLDNDSVTVFSSDPVEPGDSLYLGFRETLGGCMLRLDIEADIEGIGVNPTRPPIIWEVWTVEGWTPCLVQSDLTGGLNRDGQINIAVPTGHLSHTLLTENAYWLRLRLLAPGSDGSGYRSSPKIKSLEILPDPLWGEPTRGMLFGGPGSQTRVGTARPRLPSVGQRWRFKGILQAKGPEVPVVRWAGNGGRRESPPTEVEL